MEFGNAMAYRMHCILNTDTRGRYQATLLDLRFIESKFRIRMGHDLVQNFVFAVQVRNRLLASSPTRLDPLHDRTLDQSTRRSK
jgi:hypothetical protein